MLKICSSNLELDLNAFLFTKTRQKGEKFLNNLCVCVQFCVFNAP